MPWRAPKLCTPKLGRRRFFGFSLGLLAGDALHLACAEAAGAKHMARLDGVLSRNAQRLKIKPIELRDTR